MSMLNPLAESNRTDDDDRGLVERAQAGDRQALEELVGRHQAWIYNIAIRMVFHPQDAEDATQEILIKALTRLSSFVPVPTHTPAVSKVVCQSERHDGHGDQHHLPLRHPGGERPARHAQHSERRGQERGWFASRISPPGAPRPDTRSRATPR